MTQPAYIYDEVSRCASQFTGKERDIETGLDYFGARYFGSNIGRFWSVDPGPLVKSDPQTLNRYTYTRNNPLRFVDPTGEFFVVAAKDKPTVRAWVATMLLSENGRKLVRTAANSKLPVNVKFDDLKHEPSKLHPEHARAKNDEKDNLKGIDITIDKKQVRDVGLASGRSEFKQGLVTFGHVLKHAEAGLGASSATAADDAMKAQDRQTTRGGIGFGDTAGGEAESAGVAVVEQLGKNANAPTKDQSANDAAAQIVDGGNLDPE